MMKTDDLIALLARNAPPVDRHVIGRQVAFAGAGGALLALPLMLALLGINPELTAYFALPMFWVKLGFGLALAMVATWGVARAARPGVSLQPLGWAAAVPLASLWLLGLAALATVPAGQRAAAVFIDGWAQCLMFISLLAAPTFVWAFAALRSGAPTQPARAGALAGLLAGGVGAAIYAMHCPELGAPYLAAWYGLGVLMPAAVGALLGPRLLRW